MTTEPRAFATVDLGAATVSVALIGKVGRTWRLVGSSALPVSVGVEAALEDLLDRLRRTDGAIMAGLGLDEADTAALVRLEVNSAPARTLAVVAATERSLAPLVAAAARSGWQIAAGSAQAMDPLAMTRMLLDGATDAILVGASDPPAADERSAVGELAALVAAVAARRPDRLVVLAGGMAERLADFGDPAQRSGETVLAPAAGIGAAAVPLQTLLLQLAGPSDDARRSLGVAAASLAEVMDRHVELVEVGFDAATRALARPATASEEAWLDLAVAPGAGLAPAEPDDDIVDRVQYWSTVPTDRHRVRDRLRELRIAPWSDATGEGLAFRVAVAHAALGRLVAATADPASSHAPDLVIACGGVWSSMPSSLIALTLADVLRRPGASQLAFDHAGLLAPLGAIPDAVERRAVLADLADDVLLPLGTLVVPTGLRSGRTTGRLIVHGTRVDAARDLTAGELASVRLAPGESAVAEFKFRDSVRLGGRGRQFAIAVAGGLTGLLVDLRDVPLRLPDRAEARREQLRGWQAAVLPGGIS